MVERLTESQVRERLGDLTGWELQEGHLRKTYKFPDFKENMAFVNRVADLAEDYEHHPDLHIHYNRLTLELWTHDAGGLTEWDLELAGRINRLEAPETVEAE